MDSTRAQETKVVHSSSCSCKNMIQVGPGGSKTTGTEALPATTTMWGA